MLNKIESCLLSSYLIAVQLDISFFLWFETYYTQYCYVRNTFITSHCWCNKVQKVDNEAKFCVILFIMINALIWCNFEPDCLSSEGCYKKEYTQVLVYLKKWLKPMPYWVYPPVLSFIFKLQFGKVSNLSNLEFRIPN